MSKFGDDLIQSLKEALADAEGDGPGTEHAPKGPSGPDEVDTQADAADDED